MNLFFASRRLKYFLLARHRKGHGIHSPFVFNLFSDFFLNKPDPAVVKTVVDLKRKLQHIHLVQGANPFRDGSLRIDNIPEKGRGSMERISGCDKYCRLLALLAGKVNGSPVLQIGGGLSMATLAMAAGAAGSKVILVNRRTESEEGTPEKRAADEETPEEITAGERAADEGTPGKRAADEETSEEITAGERATDEETSEEITAGERATDEETSEEIAAGERAADGETSGKETESEKSAEPFTSYNPGAVVTGNIEMRLVDKYDSPGNICFEAGKAGLILVVANSCSNKLLYCIDMLAGAVSDKTIIIIENIHFSAEIENEWNRLISDRRVSVSIDLLRYGLLFFKSGIPKQHFLIRY